MQLRLTFIITLNLLFSAVLMAQNRAISPPLTLAEKKQVVDSLSELLNKDYIYADVAEKMSGILKENLSAGRYNAITDPAEFANKLNADIISVSHDNHINIIFDPIWILESRKAHTKQDSIAFENKDLDTYKKQNFGFNEVKMLDGNVGYLNITDFWNPSYAGETAVGAMSFLSNADAIIIDLRNNGGGYATMVQMLASYFFETDPILIVETYRRNNTRQSQDWTLPYVPGKRMPEVDLYILTSRQSFSAAESFAYFLKNRKRAVIVGESTGGGAHQVDRIAFTARYSMYIPNARPVDPITKKDWEGTGVKPDVEVKASDALYTAHLMAVEKLAAGSPDSGNIYKWYLPVIKAKKNPLALSTNLLKSYAGLYGPRKLTFDHGKLYFQRNKDADKCEMIAIGNNEFIINEQPFMKIEIVAKNGKVVAMKNLYADHSQRVFERL